MCLQPAMHEATFINQGGAVGPWDDARRRPANLRREREATTVSPEASLEVRQVVDAVCRSIALDRADLHDAFFPAHLSVAVIEAIFHSGLRPGEPPPPVAERYCRRFGLVPRRPDPWAPPPAAEQEPLGDLVRRYDETGVDGMAGTVFRSRRRSPGTRILKAENVVRAARALRRIGVDVLQDVPARRPAEIDAALRPLPGIDEATVRALLMYTGPEQFVLGDAHVRRFVASAIGERAVSPRKAETLVRNASHELILSPRLLDHEIWRHGVSGTGVATAPVPPDGQ